MGIRIGHRSIWVTGVVGCLLGACAVAGGSAGGVGAAATTSPPAAHAASVDTSPADGKSFAEALLARAPRPSGSVATARLTAPLLVLPDGQGTVDVHQDYLLKSKLDLDAFIASHRPSGALVGGPNTGSGTGSTQSTTYEFSLPLANRHVSFESLDYTVGFTSANVEELRVDAEVDWAAIQTVEMPTSGVVTLTGYGRTSDMTRSSDPTTVTLTKAQAQKLRERISSLSNAVAGGCMEDSTLFIVTVAPGAGQRTTWTATGDVCPGDLYVVSGTRHVTLVDTSCPLRSLVVSLLPKGKALATRKALKTCGPRF
jgi:hypothetical protein